MILHFLWRLVDRYLHCFHLGCFWACQWVSSVMKGRMPSTSITKVDSDRRKKNESNQSLRKLTPAPTCDHCVVGLSLQGWLNGSMRNSFQMSKMLPAGKNNDSCIKQRHNHLNMVLTWLLGVHAQSFIRQRAAGRKGKSSFDPKNNQSIWLSIVIIWLFVCAYELQKLFTGGFELRWVVRLTA